MSVIINGTSGISTDGGSELFGSGSIGGSLTLTSGTANGVTYLNGSKVLTSGSGLTWNGSTLLVDGNTRFGSGSVIPGFATASDASLANNASLRGTNAAGTTAFELIKFNTSDQVVINNDGADAVLTGAATYQRWSIGGGEQMRLTSTGLGIGTSSPAGRLQVETSGSVANLYVKSDISTSALASRIALGNSVSIARFSLGLLGGGGEVAYLGTEGSFPLYFQTNGSERLRIDSSGNVGIGTSSPTARLEIGGTNNSLFFTNSGATTGYSYSAIQNTSGNLLFGVIGSNGVFWNNGGEAYAATIGTTQAKSLIFATNNNEAARITPAGQLLVGTASINSWGSASPKIRAQGGIQISDYSLITEDVFDLDSLCIVSDSTENICFGNFTVATGTYNERMRIDSSGNVGIGTTSISDGKLCIDGGADGSSIISGRTDGGNGNNARFKITAFADGGGAGYGGGIGFQTRNSVNVFNEAMRIDSSGNLLVGTTSGANLPGSGTSTEIGVGVVDGVLKASRSQYAMQVGVSDTGTGRILMQIFQAGTSCGSITVSNSTTTSYNTSSDYRLKEDWVAVADASTRVNALKPVNFAWKADGKRVDGFLAHEVAEVVPEAVTGEKDAVDAKGNPVYQGIDQSKLVPLLTAALQEALARIESLEADVATLKGTA